MPVWHVSVARISRHLDRIIPVSEWPPNVLHAAKLLQKQMLLGVGTDWNREEIGIDAIHLRRRLLALEIRRLHQMHPACPVFTHGAATAALAERAK
jgi:hypothetical protein